MHLLFTFSFRVIILLGNNVMNAYFATLYKQVNSDIDFELY